MKVAVIGVQGIPTNQEGIGRYCQELYPRIVARSHQVGLFVHAKYHHLDRFLQQNLEFLITNFKALFSTI